MTSSSTNFKSSVVYTPLLLESHYNFMSVLNLAANFSIDPSINPLFMEMYSHFLWLCPRIEMNY